eukprot:1160372-Pelagomonas_calceolata.AAC.4
MPANLMSWPQLASPDLSGVLRAGELSRYVPVSAEHFGHTNEQLVQECTACWRAVMLWLCTEPNALCLVLGALRLRTLSRSIKLRAQPQHKGSPARSNPAGAGGASRNPQHHSTTVHRLCHHSTTAPRCTDCVTTAPQQHPIADIVAEAHAAPTPMPQSAAKRILNKAVVEPGQASEN